MSYTLRFTTQIRDAAVLKTACDRMRTAGLNVVGPIAAEAPRQGQVVRLPGWARTIHCACDEKGTVTADNDSPYYDERTLDPSTGKRVPGSGRVHPDVESGKCRAGQDGLTGDIQHLSRLNMEYRAAVIQRTADEQGGRIVYASVDAEADRMRIRVEVPG